VLSRVDPDERRRLLEALRRLHDLMAGDEALTPAGAGEEPR
jgi:hypothetical protein